MGHVNNAVIMEFFDLGKSEYFTAIGLPPEEGDHFGKKSLAVKQEVINSETNQVCAHCRTVMSGYSRITNTSAEIPNTIKERILRYEGIEY